MASYRALAYTMQALVKYHGLRNWRERIPFHDSISVNTTCMKTVAEITDGKRGGVFIQGKSNESANDRFEAVVQKLNASASYDDYRVDSVNVPSGKAKGIGYSSSAGAALTILAHRMLVGGDPDLRELSKVARIFAASASRSLVGGFSRLYVGKDDGSTYAQKFADDRAMDLRMVIVPLWSDLRTEDAHREVLTSPFFKSRIKSAQKRCDAMERAILGNDLNELGMLAERDTMELHALTMTGQSGMMVMSEDSLRIIKRVRALREEGVEAYFSMQTGPSVFINTSASHQEKVLASVRRLGYRAYLSGVGGSARLLERKGMDHEDPS